MFANGPCDVNNCRPDRNSTKVVLALQPKGQAGHRYRIVRCLFTLARTSHRRVHREQFAPKASLRCSFGRHCRRKRPKVCYQPRPVPPGAAGRAALKLGRSLGVACTAPPGTLELAWECIKANLGTCGIDGEASRHLTKRLEGVLSRLHEELRVGKIIPRPARPPRIPRWANREVACPVS